MHHEALRNWIRQDEADRGQRDDRPTTSELEELRRLRRRIVAALGRLFLVARHEQVDDPADRGQRDHHGGGDPQAAPRPAGWAGRLGCGGPCGRLGGGLGGDARLVVAGVGWGRHAGQRTRAGQWSPGTTGAEPPSGGPGGVGCSAPVVWTLAPASGLHAPVGCAALRLVAVWSGHVAERVLGGGPAQVVPAQPPPVAPAPSAGPWHRPPPAAAPAPPRVHTTPSAQGRQVRHVSHLGCAGVACGGWAGRHPGRSVCRSSTGRKITSVRAPPPTRQALTSPAWQHGSCRST
ncbi:hypothetical protein [Micromonospora sp. CPCC 205739]|uniref:hypothetical protein n=1 Tax=unclassified Micromonospora TaxID=2617518 RepID=UPI003FA58215